MHRVTRFVQTSVEVLSARWHGRKRPKLGAVDGVIVIASTSGGCIAPVWPLRALRLSGRPAGRPLCTVLIGDRDVTV